MPRDPESTRRRLVDAAARLYAQRGMGNVSLADITKAAGQKNTVAVQYHFGNRAGLLRAILERHVQVVERHRGELLARAAEGPGGDVRAAAVVVVRPLVDLAHEGWRGRAFLQVVSQLLTDPGRSREEISGLLSDGTSPGAFAALAGRCPPMPRRVLQERMWIGAAFVVRACADRAALIESARGRQGRASTKGQFEANLTDIYVGMLTAPVTAGPRASKDGEDVAPASSGRNGSTARQFAPGALAEGTRSR